MAIELSLIEQLLEFETALIAEAMGAMGCTDPEKYYTGRDIKLVSNTSGPIAGTALILTADTSTPSNKADIDELWKSYTIIEKSPLPTVVVMKAVGSRPNHECVLGDGMVKILKSYGSCGLITDGGVRDLNTINKIRFPVYAAGTVANHVQMIYKISEQPATISGITFETGSLIHADSDGILVIPEKYHQGIVEACVLARDIETRVHLIWRRSDKTPEEKRDFVTKMLQQHTKKCSALMKG